MSINRIGYSKDGLVFIVTDGEFEGKPLETITQIVPAVAHKIAAALEMSARAAEKAGVAAGPPERSLDEPDGATTH